MKFQIRSMVLYPASFKNALGSRQSISGPLSATPFIGGFATGRIRTHGCENDS